MESNASTLRLTTAAHVVVWSATAVSVLVLAVVCFAFQESNIWAQWTPAAELHQAHYAETIHYDSILRTRVNTWSNVAFLVVGLYVCALAVTDWRAESRRNFLEAHPVFSLSYGLACIGLAVGSAFFHASLTRWGQHVDVAMIFAPPLLLVVLNAARYTREIPFFRVRTPEMFIVAGLLFWVFLFGFKWSLSSTVVILFLITPLLIFALFDHRSARIETRIRYLYLAAFAMGLGVLFQALDAARVLSVGNGYFQGHSLWHICGATALWWAYAYHRSEAIVLAPNSTRRHEVRVAHLDGAAIQEPG